MSRNTIEILQLNYGWKYGDNIRVLNRATGMQQSGKLVVVDSQVALVGDTNWSEGGVTRSRGISLLINSAEVSKEYERIFNSDWELSAQPAPEWE